MFKKVLVANRGEIAVRIMRTCREMGIRTVAVHSDVDSRALHVLEADESVLLGEADPIDSYLNITGIISAAEATGADAIHPGYGFLAENPEFAEQCEASGRTFIGPPVRVIRELGDKTLARRTMESAGVSVIPGTVYPTNDPDKLLGEADKIGYPVLVKPVAGGGGKGMRVVSSPEEMQEACLSAGSEAQKAFGNGDLYLEKYLKNPRHIEFQILADNHGNAVHLFERECSIQRRHQKIIEETPSPVMTAQLRSAMGDAALSAARVAGYANAGTVEFLLDESGNFYFLEVNTRLQVEHPITEMATGIDIVRKQIEIASGEPLKLIQDDILQRGHAIECRIYAEDPENNFFPSAGRIALLREPSGPGVRNDSGIYAGVEIPVEYDPILSKLIVTAETRKYTLARMIRALESYVILGIKTIIPFLIDLFKSPQFLEGNICTNFIDRHFKDWRQNMNDADLAGIVYVMEEKISPNKLSPGKSQTDWPTPWETLGNWKV